MSATHKGWISSPSESLPYQTRPVAGFLCTEDGSSPGNYGLMDQIKALEWVRDSISAFNGDPNDVTIFGESAGGASVSLLILARQARGLFQKGIMESGVSLCPWAVSYPRLQPEPLSQAVELARRMECATHATNELVACLRTKDAMALLNATTDMRNSDPSIMLFRPVPETTFGRLLNVFDSDPQSLLEHGLFSNVSTIRGYNAHEAGWTIHDPEDDGITLDEFKAIMHEIVTDYLIRNPRPIRIASMESLLLDLYVNTPNITDPKELREAYIQMETDLLYAAPIMRELQWTTRYSGKPQYLYRFNYSSANRIDAAWRGALHAADVPYVFGSPIDGSPLWSLVNTWTDDDRTMSGTIMDMWTNFAKFGTPTPDSNGTKWLPWKPTSPNSLDIELHPVALAASPISPQLTSWLEAIPDLQRSPGELIG